MNLALARAVCRKAAIAGGRCLDKYIPAIGSMAVQGNGRELEAIGALALDQMRVKVSAAFDGEWHEEAGVYRLLDVAMEFRFVSMVDPFACALDAEAAGSMCTLFAAGTTGAWHPVVSAVYLGSASGVFVASENEIGLRWNNQPPKFLDKTNLERFKNRLGIGTNLPWREVFPAFQIHAANFTVRPLLTSPFQALRALYEGRVERLVVVCTEEIRVEVEFFAHTLCGSNAWVHQPGEEVTPIQCFTGGELS